MRPGDVVKVKYGEKNGEVYAEIAASRLFWALGFKVDRSIRPASVVGTVPLIRLPPARGIGSWEGHAMSTTTCSIRPRLSAGPGSPIEVPGFEGWAWPEWTR